MNSRPESNLTASIHVQTRILGRPSETSVVALPAGPIRTVDLIRTKVEAEWLQAPAVREGTGRDGAGPEWLSGSGEAPSTVDEAVLAAVDAYRAGWYIILVDGSEPGGLDSRLTLDASSAVSFVWGALPPAAPREDL